MGNLRGWGAFLFWSGLIALAAYYITANNLSPRDALLLAADVQKVRLYLTWFYGSMGAVAVGLVLWIVGLLSQIARRTTQHIQDDRSTVRPLHERYREVVAQERLLDASTPEERNRTADLPPIERVASEAADAAAYRAVQTAVLQDASQQQRGQRWSHTEMGAIDVFYREIDGEVVVKFWGPADAFRKLKSLQNPLAAPVAEAE